MALVDHKISFLVLVACSFVLALHLTGVPVAGRRRQQDDDSVAWDRGEESDFYSDSQYEDSEEQEDQDIEPVNPDNLLCGQSRYDRAEWKPKFSDPSERILAGEPTRPGEHPFLVQLFMGTEHNVKPSCGGVLIESDIVLTAAHCVKRLDKSRSYVVLGVHKTNGPIAGLQLRRILDIKKNINHTDRTPTSDYDIAVIRIEDTKYKLEPNQDHGSINRICMPEKVSQFEGPFIAIGWGATSIHVDTEPNYTNPSPYPLQYEVDELINEPEVRLCTRVEAGAPSAMRGDSGGPLIRWLHPNGPGPRQAELIGLVSYGVFRNESISYDCFTNVMKLKLWINRVIRMIR